MGIFKKEEEKPVETQERDEPFNILQFRNNYLQATANRLNKGWFRYMPTDINAEYEQNIEKLRSLSRRLSVENVYVKRYLSVLITNVIGSKGIQFIPKVRRGKRSTNSLNESVNAELKAAWTAWAKSPFVDESGNIVDLQESALRSAIEDGEAFVHFVIDPEVNQFGFALELIDAALLDHTFTVAAGTQVDHYILKNRVVQGIELDKFDRPVAYWFWNKHEQSRIKAGSRKRVRYEKLNPESKPLKGGILHLHYKAIDRANQLRGKPWVTPALYWLARLQDYLEAELIAAQIAATTPGFITQQKSDATAFLNQNLASQNVNTSGTSTRSTGESGGIAPSRQRFEESVKFDLGTFLVLPPGESVEVPDFKRPNQAIQTMVTTFLHGVAAALDLNYATLSTDFSESNYSASKLAVAPEREHFQRIQAWFIRALLEPLYRVWLRQMILASKVKLPTQNPDDYMEINFRPRGWFGVDQLRDQKALEMQLRFGAASEQMIAEMLGQDYEAILQEQVDAKEMRGNLGLPEMMWADNKPTLEVMRDPAGDDTNATDEDEG